MGRRAVRLVLATALVLGAALVGSGWQSVQAGVQTPIAGGWEQTGFREEASKLFAHSSGALFAVSLDKQGPARLFRGDDASAAWRPVKQPPARPTEDQERFGWLMAVDPIDPNVLYAAGAEGLYKTEDDAATWRLVYPFDDVILGASALRVSAADRQLLYLHLAPRFENLKLLRSRDGGFSWEQVANAAAESICGDQGSAVFYPHPRDSRRLFGTTNCTRAFSAPNLSASSDQGAQWSVLFEGAARGAFPLRLVGGSGLIPERLYLGAGRHVQASGLVSTLVFRSDDDGRTWTESLPFGTGESELGVGGLAYDPANPDLVFVAHASLFRMSEVRMSADGGESWVDLGGRGLGTIADLALSADAQTLFMATKTGVHRLRLR